MKKLFIYVSILFLMIASIDAAVEPINFKLKLDVNGINNIYFTSYVN